MGTRRGRSMGLYVQKWQEPEVAAGALWLAAGRASGDSVGGGASRCSLWMGLMASSLAWWGSCAGIRKRLKLYKYAGSSKLLLHWNSWKRLKMTESCKIIVMLIVFENRTFMELEDLCRKSGRKSLRQELNACIFFFLWILSPAGNLK